MTNEDKRKYLKSTFAAGNTLFCIDRRDTLAEWADLLYEMEEAGELSIVLNEIETQYSRLEVRPTQKLLDTL